MALAAFLVCLVLWPPVSQSALPPSYGGTIRLPVDHLLDHPIDTPQADGGHTPFERVLSRAVYHRLGQIGQWTRLRDNTIDGSLVQVYELRLHAGLLRRGRRQVSARDVLAALRRLTRTPRAHWLEPLLRMNIEDTRTLTLTFVSDVDVERWIDSDAVSLRIPTGPFTYSRTRRRLEHFRHSLSGAPTLNAIELHTFASRRDALRAFVLGEVDGSFFGAQVLGEARSEPTARRQLGLSSAVVLYANRTHRGELSFIASHLSRRRLERTGLEPRRSISEALRVTGDTPQAPLGPRTLGYRDGDSVSQRVAEALRAQMDEFGARVRLVPMTTNVLESWDPSRDASPDFVVTQFMPGLDSANQPIALEADALAAAGMDQAARQTLIATLRGQPLTMQEWPAVTLGINRPTLELPTWIRSRTPFGDGPLRLEALYITRAERARQNEQERAQRSQLNQSPQQNQSPQRSPRP